MKRELLHYNKKSLSNFGVHLIDEFHDVQPQAARRKASTEVKSFYNGNLKFNLGYISLFILWLITLGYCLISSVFNGPFVPLFHSIVTQIK